MSDDARRWLVLLLPPLAWSAHLLIGYSLHPSICDANSRAMAIIVTIVLLLGVAATGWMAFALWQALPDPLAGGGAGKPEDEEPRWRARARFMAFAGFLASGLFGLVIVGQSIPMLILRTCD
jgi:hypothetical protein